MATYHWSPFDEPGWTTVISGHSDGIMPFVTGGVPPGKLSTDWADLQANDTLVIAAHGKAWSDERVVWECVDGSVCQWTAGVFAAVLKAKLGSHHAMRLNYKLMACFGANKVSPRSQSYGARLAAEMSSLGLRGSLTVYKGATGLGALEGTQIGSGRISAYVLRKSKLGRWLPGKSTDESAVVIPL